MIDLKKARELLGKNLEFQYLASDTRKHILELIEMAYDPPMIFQYIQRHFGRYGYDLRVGTEVDFSVNLTPIIKLWVQSCNGQLRVGIFGIYWVITDEEAQTKR